MTQHESDTAASNEAETQTPDATTEEATMISDDDGDIEDLEFLIDDIEDQIAPLG